MPVVLLEHRGVAAVSDRCSAHVRRGGGFGSTFALAAILVAISAVAGACNNGLGGFSGNVGNTPSVNAEISYKVLGNIGTPFSALISDSRASWVLNGTIPFSFTIINALNPSRITVTKLSSDTSLMSIEILAADTILDLSSTNDPYGTASVQTGGKLFAIAPEANPDLRINILGPSTERYTGLVEDQTIGFTVQDRAPTTYLFDSPVGQVVGQFNSVENLGGLVANLTINGKVVAKASSKGTSMVIKSP